jgi:ubiquinone/menaquinone biosynthesis C-methylase UbiE
LPEKIPEPFVDLYLGFAREAFDHYYLETAREILTYCPSGSVLDVGCGPGFLPLQLATLSDEVTVHGVDLSPKMIRLAMEHAKAFHLEARLRFTVNDGNRLKNIPDESYDMVISTGVFHSLKRPEVFLNECHRVLKTGREAWVFDPAVIVSSRVSLLGVGRKLPRKLIPFLGMVLLFRFFKPRQYPLQEVMELVSKSRFSSHTVSGNGYMKMKLRK